MRLMANPSSLLGDFKEWKKKKERTEPQIFPYRSDDVIQLRKIWGKKEKKKNPTKMIVPLESIGIILWEIKYGEEGKEFNTY